MRPPDDQVRVAGLGKSRGRIGSDGHDLSADAGNRLAAPKGDQIVHLDKPLEVAAELRGIGAVHTEDERGPDAAYGVKLRRIKLAEVLMGQGQGDAEPSHFTDHVHDGWGGESVSFIAVDMERPVRGRVAVDP